MDDDREIPALTADQIDTIKLDDLFTNDVYIDTTSMSSYSYSSLNIPSNITISTTSGSNGTTWASPWYAAGANGAAGPSGLHVKNDAEIGRAHV